MCEIVSPPKAAVQQAQKARKRKRTVNQQSQSITNNNNGPVFIQAGPVVLDAAPPVQNEFLQERREPLIRGSDPVSRINMLAASFDSLGGKGKIKLVDLLEQLHKTNFFRGQGPFHAPGKVIHSTCRDSRTSQIYCMELVWYCLNKPENLKYLEFLRMEVSQSQNTSAYQQVYWEIKELCMRELAAFEGLDYDLKKQEGGPSPGRSRLAPAMPSRGG